MTSVTSATSATSVTSVTSSVIIHHPSSVVGRRSGLALNASLRPLVALTPMLFHCGTIWQSTKLLGCSVSLYSSSVFYLLRQSCVCIPQYFSPAFFGSDVLKTCKKFCSPRTRLCILGCQATYCQRRKHERPHANTDGKPIVLAFVFSFCLDSALPVPCKRFIHWFTWWRRQPCHRLPCTR